MTLKQLAEKFHALEAIDKAPFQRSARILQSIWRDEQGFPADETRSEPRGYLLPMPWAQETLANYLTDNIRDVVRSEVLDSEQSDGKLYGKPRIFNHLLSSQPLCFNLFGELTSNLEMASRVVSRLTHGRFAEVTGIDFEYSPGRSDPAYTDDRSAFDVFLRCKTEAGEPAFLGIEVKYHETLKGKPGRHRERYSEVAEQMDCFKDPRDEKLRETPLQQIWCDHLLSGAVKLKDDFSDAAFVFLYPTDNLYCRDAVAAYRQFLKSDDSFLEWTIEDVVAALEAESGAEWVGMIRDRYLAFEKLDMEDEGENFRLHSK